MAFEVQLNRVQTTKVWRSEGPATSNQAKRLQELFDQGLSEQYQSERSEMENNGAKFRLTNGKVFQIFDSEKTIQVPINVQIKGGCITWYIIAPLDETHQEFRDEVYQAAALGHLSVDNHCEKYWRGTNSLHVKKMHTKESEAGLNHNHYRVQADREVGPIAVFQHLTGFVRAQRTMGLMASSDGKSVEKFLTMEEAREISHKFNVHWTKVNHVGAPQQTSVGKEKVVLPKREESLFSAYQKSPLQRLTKEDLHEWETNRHKEEPCTTISEEMPIKDKIKAIQVGMRGIGSELANTRQMANSELAEIATVVKA